MKRCSEKNLVPEISLFKQLVQSVHKRLETAEFQLMSKFNGSEWKRLK